MKNADLTIRQNDAEAIHLLKASHRCLTNEKRMKYLTVFLSFGICLAAIFNRYLIYMLPGVEDIAEIQAELAKYLNITSGAIILLTMVLNFYCHRMHTEGTVLQDRYEAYVFDNKANVAILKPISQAIITLYYRKVRKPDEKFQNSIYKEGDTYNEATAQYDYIRKRVQLEYRLYLSVQPFFLTVWIGFCVMIFVIAIAFDYNLSFQDTLLNIFIPSLSAITMIGSSWYNYRLQIRQLSNLLSIVEQIDTMSQEKRNAYIADKKNMRALADGLYNYRSSSFVIPNFLINRFNKNMEKKKDVENVSIGSELQKLNGVGYGPRTGKKKKRKKSKPVQIVVKAKPTARQNASQSAETKSASSKANAAQQQGANKSAAAKQKQSSSTSKPASQTAKPQSKPQESKTETKPAASKSSDAKAPTADKKKK